MDWQAVGAIGEITGAFAVVASLIFVGWQLRQNTSALRTSTSQSHVEGYNSIAKLAIEDKEVARLWRIGLAEGMDALDEDDRVRFISFLSSLFRYYDASYLQFTSGNLDPQLSYNISQQVKSLAASPGFAEWWQLRSYLHSREMQAVVNEAMNAEDSIPLLYDRPETQGGTEPAS